MAVRYLGVRRKNFAPLADGIMFAPAPHRAATPSVMMHVVGAEVFRICHGTVEFVADDVDHTPFVIGVFTPPEESRRFGKIPNKARQRRPRGR